MGWKEVCQFSQLCNKEVMQVTGKPLAIKALLSVMIRNG